MGRYKNYLLAQAQKQTNSIVFGIRLPRVVTALIAGMALGMVGCVMQSVLRNPLADASTLASHKAAFGATVAIICFGAGAQKYSFCFKCS